MGSTISSFFVPFLIKMAASCPAINSHIFKLLEVICKRNSKHEKTRIINILTENLKFIDEYFWDSELQIWSYYLIAKYADRKRKKILNSYIHQLSIKDSYAAPIILCVFVQNNLTTNYSIFKFVLGKYGSNSSGERLRGVSKSMWWIVIVALYKFLKKTVIIKNNHKYNEISNEVIPLFEIVNENQGVTPNYQELGVFTLLMV